MSVAIRPTQELSVGLRPTQEFSVAIRPTQELSVGLRPTQELCGQASLYSGYSMRVGDANHTRMLGMADELLRQMGGWASLTSAQGYIQRSAKEQFELANRLALKERLTPKVEGEGLAPIAAVRRPAVCPRSRRNSMVDIRCVSGARTTSEGLGLMMNCCA